MFVGKMSVKMIPIMSRGFDCLISWKQKYCFNKPRFCSKSYTIIIIIMIRNTASPSHLPPTKFALADSCSCCRPSTSSGRFSVFQTSFSLGRFADLLGDDRSLHYFPSFSSHHSLESLFFKRTLGNIGVDRLISDLSQVRSLINLTMALKKNMILSEKCMFFW